jgi:hypothetical protein
MNLERDFATDRLSPQFEFHKFKKREISPNQRKKTIGNEENSKNELGGKGGNPFKNWVTDRKSLERASRKLNEKTHN